jgi:hypothetical protein
MRACLIICGLLLCGCSRSPEKVVPAGAPPQAPTVLDEGLAKYSNALVRAQQELPTDKWEEKPFRHNLSRDQRVGAVAKPMFDEITARLKGLSVTNLVGSLKTVPYPHGDLTNRFDEAAEYVYAVGNQLIKNEIKTRPPEQLSGLPKLGSDKYMLVEGPQGFGLPLTYELQEILDDLGLTNGWSR